MSHDHFAINGAPTLRLRCRRIEEMRKQVSCVMFLQWLNPTSQNQLQCIESSASQSEVRNETLMLYRIFSRVSRVPVSVN